MRETDLSIGRATFRLAFGTFLGLPDPSTFAADQDYVFTRWRADPAGALAADIEGALVGSNFAVRWGSFGVIGPLTVHPGLWRHGVAKALLASTIDLFNAWNIKQAGLFTFAHSIGHVNLYQTFDFWPQFLTMVMSKPIDGNAQTRCLKYADMKLTERGEVLAECRSLTNALLDGLDLTLEINSVADQTLGETLLLWSQDVLDGFAVCHCGEGTEAGVDICYVKFAGVRPGPNAAEIFGQLLEACDALARDRGLKRVEAGVNVGRSLAYQAMLQRGFRTKIQGIALQKFNSQGYNRPNAYVIDDWR